jgi:putative addiction module antidote
MKRKLVKVGNSLAVTLPRDLVRELGLQAGQEVETSIDHRNGNYVVRAGAKEFEGGKASPRFNRMVDQLIQDRRELYERLS